LDKSLIKFVIDFDDKIIGFVNRKSGDFLKLMKGKTAAIILRGV